MLRPARRTARRPGPRSDIAWRLLTRSRWRELTRNGCANGEWAGGSGCRPISELHAHQPVVAGAAGLMVVAVQMVVLDGQLVEAPDVVLAAVVELLADQDVVERFPRLLEDVGVINVVEALQLLQGLGGIERRIAARRTAPRLQVIWLAGDDVERVAVLAVVEVAEDHHRIVRPL